MSRRLVYTDEGVSIKLAIENALLYCFPKENCLQGIYQDTHFSFSTISPEGSVKRMFIIGCGGGVNTTDLCLAKSTGASMRHCELRFENNEWQINDERSLNGTYILLKSFDQFRSKRISNLIPLFQKEHEYLNAILLSKYIFTILVRYR